METDYYRQLEREVPDMHTRKSSRKDFNPLNAKLNPIFHLLALLGAHHILHVSRIRIKHAKFKYVFSFLSHSVILNIKKILNCKVV